MKQISTKTTVNTIVETIFATKYDELTIVKTVTNDGEPHYRLNRVKKDTEKLGHLTFVKPEFFDFIKTRDPHRQYDDMKIKGGHWSWNNFVIDEYQISVEEMYDLIENDQFVYWFSSGHQIFDCNKEILPFARHFEYGDSVFDNGKSDLPKLIEYLKTHDWVVNKDSLEITNIPYYNNNELHSKSLEVVIYPDTKSYKSFYDRCKDKDNWSIYMNDYVKRYRITEDFDPMGLRPFLKEEK